MFTNHGAHCTCVVTSGWCNAQAQGGETTYVCVGIDLNHVQTQTLLYFNAGGVQDQSAVGDLAASAQPYNGGGSICQRTPEGICGREDLVLEWIGDVVHETSHALFGASAIDALQHDGLEV